ncbi:hypothetical protein [Sandarakinorhabdus sp.]|uniref:hypothetical protein n=1 Tax=Sandarakinorhabdus sp. TaxID=1916663 RepID=UPI0035627063
MKTVPNGFGSQVSETKSASSQLHTSFYVELTPIAVDARPFHALHGIIPGALVASSLPTHWEADPEEPAPPTPKAQS